MFNCKKVFSLILAITMLFGISSPAFAQNAGELKDKSQLAQNYTVDDIKALEPYVSVENGHFTLDVKQEKADKIDIQLINGQLEFFDLLNDKADAGDIKIEENLTIVNSQVANPVRSAAVDHWASCGGGVNTDAASYWWGYARYACDCQTRKISADFGSASSIAGGVAIASAFFAAPLVAPSGLSAAYWYLISSRLDANNRGYGCYIAISWALVFDIEPQ